MFSENNYKNLASQKMCGENISIFTRKTSLNEFSCVYGKQDFSLFLLMVGLSPGV
jgi:hypothetical protein